MSVISLQQKNYQLEDREMEGYAIVYHAYLARRDLPGPEPTFADFVEIRKLQGEIERLLPENLPSLDDAYVEPATRRTVWKHGFVFVGETDELS